MGLVGMRARLLKHSSKKTVRESRRQRMPIRSSRQQAKNQRKPLRSFSQYRMKLLCRRVRGQSRVRVAAFKQISRDQAQQLRFWKQTSFSALSVGVFCKLFNV